jgi:3-oxoacyl-[acyl-carrier-protein] synthase-3
VHGTPRAVEHSYLKMISGPSVLRTAVNKMAGCVHRVLGYEDGSNPACKDTMAGMRLIPHQANGRIVDGLAKKLGANPDRVTKTLYKAGNISAASSMIALDYAMRDGNLRAQRDEPTGRITKIDEIRDPIEKGELIVMPTIAAGYLFGAVAFVHPG